MCVRYPYLVSNDINQYSGKKSEKMINVDPCLLGTQEYIAAKKSFFCGTEIVQQMCYLSLPSTLSLPGLAP